MTGSDNFNARRAAQWTRSRDCVMYVRAMRNLRLGVIVVAGCAHAIPKIDASKVSKLDARLQLSTDRRGGDLCVHSFMDARKPGSASIAIRATMPDGVRDSDDPKEDRRFDIHEVKATASAGSVEHYKSSVLWVTAPAQEVALEGDVTIEFEMAKNPQARGKVTLVPTFDCATDLSFEGTRAYDGERGTDGNAGGASQNGNNGGDGGVGNAGEPGPDVEVRIAMRDTKRGKLAELSVTAPGHDPVTTLVGPTTKVFVTSTGGGGGSGGHGGTGGAGGQLPPGPCDHLAYGGAGGRGGTGGLGGAGGRIVVMYDPAYPELKSIVIGKSVGGSGGPGGPAGEGGSWGPPNQGCSIAESGFLGSVGSKGNDGPPGADGPAAEYVAGLGRAPGGRPTHEAHDTTRPTTSRPPTSRPTTTRPTTSTPGSPAVASGKALHGTYTLSAGGRSVNGAVNISVESSATPRFTVDVLGCTLETTRDTSGWQVVPATCGTYEILKGQIKQSGAGYKVTLGLQQIANVNGRSRTVDGIFKVTVLP